MNIDEKYMARCLQLARLGGGHTSPNPMVGAVIVHNDRIIGEGYHQQFGEPHAEPNAIKSVKDQSLLSESTIYVNLEPCSHWGKTPPCANLIIEKKIKRVVIGCFDPNPKVAGNGVKILQDAGVEVSVGILEKEARALNKRFITFQEKKRPFILLKWAETADGFIDIKREDNQTPPLKISNKLTTQLMHKMRSENMSILVSSRTALLDNPSLTVRDWEGKNPIRLAIDRFDKIPDNFNIKETEKNATIIFTTTDKKSSKNLQYITISKDINNLPTILDYLYHNNIHSIMVEGGTTLLNSFIQNNLWDEINIEISNQYINSGVKAPLFYKQKPYSKTNIDGHQWLHFVNTTI